MDREGAGRPRSLQTFLEVVPRATLVFPVLFAVVFVLLAPNYFQPMLSTQVGLWLLGAAVVVLAAVFGISELAVRLMRGRGLSLALGIVVWAGAFLLDFVALWIVLLGPAIVILTRK